MATSVAASGPSDVCEHCGRPEPDDGSAALTWSTSVEEGRRRLTCDTCAREHLRAIEGKLDHDWW